MRQCSKITLIYERYLVLFYHLRTSKLFDILHFYSYLDNKRTLKYFNLLQVKRELKLNQTKFNRTIIKTIVNLRKNVKYNFVIFIY
jgi:hypothetical protein